jgi:Tfp pilus assembly protein PilX
MLIHRLNMLIRSQRGVALPIALLTMLILSALIIAFSMMSASEPVLANNQLRVAQARAIAESGVERAIWALNNPGNANGISNFPPAAPYDGSTAIPVTINGVQVGVFTVKVTNGDPSCRAANERCIVATGWTPTNTGTGPKVKQKIQVTVFQQIRFLNPPSALTVRGEISMGGSSCVDARSDDGADTSCGNITTGTADTSCGGHKTGTTSKGSTATSGSAAVWGADGNNVKNQSTDIIQNVADPPVGSVWDKYKYSNAELDALKALAKANGTYYQGTVAFSSSNLIPNGIIYVDTVSGQNIDLNGANTTPTSDFASVTIARNAARDPSGILSGMLIVAGSISISGTFQMHGLVYAQDDYTNTGGATAGFVTGAVLSQNVRTVVTSTGGNANVIYHCTYARIGAGYLPQTFTIEAGTYKEISG